jgi:hypothetical protein
MQKVTHDKHRSRRAQTLTAAAVLLLFGQTRLPAQTAAAGKPLTTATQAVLSYTAPDDAACTIEVREVGSTALVHDVDPALFADSQNDLLRPGSSIQGRHRVVVIGKRAAEKATNGKRYSRALQADTEHTFSIQCSTGAPYTGRLRTTNIMLGNSYMEPIPADPLEPGATAWPTLSWTDRDEKIIDPQTGALMRRVSLPTDTASTSIPRYFASADPGANWTNASAVIADDTTAATYSGSTQDVLFLELGMVDWQGGSHSGQTSRMNQLALKINGWCDGGDCSTASADDRSIEFCITIDRVSCISQSKTAVLEPCTSGCTGAPYRVTLGDDMANQAYLPSWFPDAYTTMPFDHTSMYERQGTVNRNGNQITLVNGNRFDLKWKSGSKLLVNGQLYTIASVDTEAAITLSDGPVGSESSVSYRAPNFGILIHKKTVSETPLTLQNVTGLFAWGEGPGNWDAAGGIESYTNCSSALSEGPGGEMGWHCHISDGLYWIGKDSGTVRPIGRPLIGYRAGVDGWNTFYCSTSAFWDKQNANVLYCAFRSWDTTSILKLEYFGQNQTVLQDFYTPIKECGTQPCWVITNLTKASEHRTIGELVNAFHPDFASFKNRGFRLLTSNGNTSRFLLQASRDWAINDSLGFFAYFNAATGNIDAAGPSWKYWPVRWSVVHGFQDIGDPSWTLWPVTHFRGSFGNTDYVAGNGPYYSRVASGAITTTGEACPERPNDSPIPQVEWPVGNVCLTVTVDGEPGDPSPMKYESGTITTSGNTVTGSGVSWEKLADGLKMKIGTDYYTFTWISSTTGTLSPEPPQVTDSPYTLFMEEVDNPKTGTARREHAYLQDAEVRDIFCGTNNTSPSASTTNGCGLFFMTEHFRLIVKSGNTWILERGYNKKPFREQFFALQANAYLITVPTACDFTLYPCGVSAGYWNIDTDPLGQGSGMFTSGALSKGGGHSITRPTVEVSGVAFDGCPTVDGTGFSCYNVRMGPDIPGTLLNPQNHVVTGQPAFAGLLGIGVPNVVDVHPSLPGPVSPSFLPGHQKWFVDGRPMVGGTTLTGSSSNPATLINGDLYKLTSSQILRMRRKTLPTMAACGTNPLVDVSGPGSLLTGNSSDSYRYCHAEQNGECNPSSQKGDVFFNCPQFSLKYCSAAPIGSLDADMRDICIGDHAGYTNSLIQVGYERQNMSGAYGRAVTKALTRNRWTDVYWNTKVTPDGQWLITRVMWANAFGHEVLLVKLPPFPAVDSVNRADFIQTPVDIAASKDPAETHAVVEFGYDPNFNCTSRAEVCVKGGAPAYAFAYENVAGVSCATGCQIKIPAIPQRILYYRVVRRDSAGQRLWVGPTEIVATP